MNNEYKLNAWFVDSGALKQICLVRETEANIIVLHPLGKRILIKRNTATMGVFKTEKEAVAFAMTLQSKQVARAYAEHAKEVSKLEELCNRLEELSK